MQTQTPIASHWHLSLWSPTGHSFTYSWWPENLAFTHLKNICIDDCDEHGTKVALEGLLHIFRAFLTLGFVGLDLPLSLLLGLLQPVSFRCSTRPAHHGKGPSIVAALQVGINLKYEDVNDGLCGYYTLIWCNLQVLAVGPKFDQGHTYEVGDS